MRIKFYLKKEKVDGRLNSSPTAIYSLINYEGNSLKIYTGESVLPKYWNKQTNSARNTPAFPEHVEFNLRLNNIRSTINRVFLDFRNKNNHQAPSPAVLKQMIESAMKRGTIRTTFLEYFADFVQRSINGQRFDPRSREPVRLGVAKGYRTTLNHLTEFSKSYKRKLDFDTIDLEFHHDFTKYLSGQLLRLSANSIGSQFQRIKAVMSESTEKGVNTNMAFKSKLFIKQTEEADTIYLTEAELNEMENLDLSKEPRLDNVRNLFLVGAYTGLRFSDFSILTPKHIFLGFIEVVQTKTKKPVVIPVHTVVKKIIKRNDGQFPRPISNEKTNQFLKEIGEMMKTLKGIETKTMTKGNDKISVNKPKWKMLTTHCARRSFCTNEYLKGTPTVTIMAISGHKTEKSFLKYIRVTPKEHAGIIEKLWKQREKSKKAKGKVVNF